MNIHYRNALRNDIPFISRLIEIASGGFIDYLYNGIFPDKTTNQIIQDKLNGKEPSMNWEDCILAESEGGVAGLSLSYPAHLYRITSEMERIIPEERLEKVRGNYSEKVENSWYLDSLAVFPEYTGKGIGGRLIDYTKARALERGFDVLSLSVFADNKVALDLYLRHGFRKVRRVLIEPSEESPHEGGCFIMKCDLK